jgi:predicted MFS family arabinose efflux permease
MSHTNSSVIEAKSRERLLRVLAGITFLIFFQAYMVGPMIPRLSATFGVSVEKIGLLIPAYLIPYGVSTLFFGLLSDWIGRKRIMFVSLAAFAGLTGLTATAMSDGQMIFWRLLTGLGASGVVPLALALMGDLFPYEQRGRPLGWLFGAMAGGMAFGSTFGVMLDPVIGWRGVFVCVSAFGFAGLVLLRPYMGILSEQRPTRTMKFDTVIAGYKNLLFVPRAQRTYLFVFLNAIFHSGVFSWLGLYFSRRYGLGEVRIGLALLGYGVPGFVLGARSIYWARRRSLGPAVAGASGCRSCRAFSIPSGSCLTASCCRGHRYDPFAWL